MARTQSPSPPTARRAGDWQGQAQQSRLAGLRLQVQGGRAEESTRPWGQAGLSRAGHCLQGLTASEEAFQLLVPPWMNPPGDLGPYTRRGQNNYHYTAAPQTP